ncbi:MAG: hypothetical protein JSW22_01765 [Chloroflexota bacterium]|nr:MAG: hypothetical protein JSW22_01765 [Chloroflexota bacterium]
MRAIFSFRKHSYLKTIGAFIIAVALIAGVAGCEGEGEPVRYDLTISSTAGGVVTAPGEGTFTYDEGEDVGLVAVPDCGYGFDVWTGDTAGIANINAAVTNITMNANYSITANFVPLPPDHYKLYWTDWLESVMPETLPVDVKLEDQFGTFYETVGEVEWFGNPVKKVHGSTTTEISDWDGHYTFYRFEHDENWTPSSFQVTINNQFQDDEQLTVQGPVLLGVPTQKEDQPMSDCLDHLLVYYVLHPVEYVPEPLPGDITVDLYDQFHDELGVTVYEPMFFANPVTKTIIDTSEVTPATTDDHFVFYPLYDQPFEKSGLPISNQFGDQTLDIGDAALLAVPSEKIGWEQPLDHFKTYWSYWAEGPIPPGFPVTVQLEDQFIAGWLGEPLVANVTEPVLFANPVEKWVDPIMPTPIWNPNNHLTFYGIHHAEGDQVWEVIITNQFDPGVTQTLWVVGPILLAVPTQKAEHGPPDDLNHFLVYFVEDWTVTPGELEVYLVDQFLERPAWVYDPELFAVPCQKTVAGGAPTPIIGDEHLAFYQITGGEFWIPALPVENQFGPQDLFVYESGEWDLLGLPSGKIEWTYVGPYMPL